MVFSFVEYEWTAAAMPMIAVNNTPIPNAHNAVASSFVRSGSLLVDLPDRMSSMCVRLRRKTTKIATRATTKLAIAPMYRTRASAESRPTVVSNVRSSPIPPADNVRRLLSCSNDVLNQALTLAA